MSGSRFAVLALMLLLGVGALVFGVVELLRGDPTATAGGGLLGGLLLFSAWVVHDTRPRVAPTGPTLPPMTRLRVAIIVVTAFVGTCALIIGLLGLVASAGQTDSLGRLILQAIAVAACLVGALLVFVAWMVYSTRPTIAKLPRARVVSIGA